MSVSCVPEPLGMARQHMNKYSLRLCWNRHSQKPCSETPLKALEALKCAGDEAGPKAGLHSKRDANFPVQMLRAVEMVSHSSKAKSSARAGIIKGCSLLILHSPSLPSNVGCYY